MNSRNFEVQLAQLRPLLHLSRELLQSDDAAGSLELIGKTLAEMLNMDCAILIMRTEGAEYIVGFDQAGMAQYGDPHHPLYRDGLACLDRGRNAGAQRETTKNRQAPRWRHASVQAVGVPRARRDKAENEMRLLSLTDGMTGLDNRRGFFLHAEPMFKVAQRQHTPSAVIFADIDGLKRVNDELGHAAGDRLICDAADDERPAVVLERIRTNQRTFNLTQGRPYQVSFSTGIVECAPTGQRDLADYLLMADQKMYLQKRQHSH